MKKILLFLPALLALALYIILGSASGFAVISPLVWVNISLLLASAFLMLKNKWYGCIGGLIVGSILIFMSSQYTGQVIDIERPLGIILCVYYLILGIGIYKKNQ